MFQCSDVAMCGHSIYYNINHCDIFLFKFNKNKIHMELNPSTCEYKDRHDSDYVTNANWYCTVKMSYLLLISTFNVFARWQHIFANFDMKFRLLTTIRNYSALR